MKAKIILPLSLVFLGLHSCIIRDVDYRTDEGTVMIRPDWSGYDLPVGTKYYFYNMDGVSAPIEVNGSAEGFSGVLPTGNYKMIAYNTDATQVEFQAMDKFETAAAHAMINTRHAATRQSDVRCILQPENLYALTLGQIEVKYLKETQVSVVPQPLTKTIRLQFSLTGDGVDNSKKVTGELCGVYPTLLLATGEPTAESIDNCPNITTAFSVKLNGNQGVADIKVFGLLDPEDGTNYTNRLILSVTDKNNRVRNAEIDLSEIISKVIKENGGAIPIEIPLNIDIKVELKDVALGIEVTPWKEDTGSGEI